MAGANSIFYGEKLLTTGNAEAEADLELLQAIGARALKPGEAGRPDQPVPLGA